VDPFEELPFASVDHHRALRQGFPEVVFGQGKTPEQVVAIAERIVARGDGLLATRLAADAAERWRRASPGSS
jgi:NCAIR mutase (PurE)-related protein